MGKRKHIVLTLLLFLVLLIPGVKVDASSGYYSVDKFHITVDILENGDAVVLEELHYNFEGEFNGILRDIDYSRTSGLRDLTVSVLEGGVLKPFEEAYSGSAYTYEVDDTGSLKKLKIYERSRYEKKTFYIGYTLTNVAEKYNDVATFNRKIIDSGWSIPLKDISIQITIPEGASREELRVFAHGPLTGASEIVDERTFFFTVPSLNQQFVETLVVFPRQLIPSSTNIFDRDELAAILENEGNLAEEANRRREEAQEALRREEQRKNMEKTSRPLFGAGILGGLASILIIIKRYGKELKPEFFGDYYRELPEDYSPAVMTYLLTKGQTKDVDIMATILDMARKKVVKLTPVKVEKGRIFKKEEDSFEMTWLDSSKVEGLLPHEKFLGRWFIDEVGQGKGIVFADLERILKSNKAALQFQKDYTYFKHKVKESGDKEQFFMKNTLPGAKIFVILGLVLMVAGGLGFLLLQSFIAMGTALLGLFSLLAILLMKAKRMYSRRGVEHKTMWEAFKKFLQHFSNMENAEIPSLVIWEHYLVYATSLGVANEVIDQLPKVFSEQELSNPNLTYMGGYRSFGQFYVMNQALTSTMSTVNSAVHTAQVAASQKSSGSGSGGGFSGGSSGGGGGGGGGGAF